MGVEREGNCTWGPQILARFVHGSMNEELIVEIFGNASLSSDKNSLISRSSTAVSHEAVFLFCLFFFLSLCVE